MTAPWLELTAAILAGVPRLPGASCRREVALFDRAADGNRLAAQEAVAICQSCPVLDQCQRWVDLAYPRRKPGGVFAGVYAPPTTQREARKNE